MSEHRGATIGVHRPVNNFRHREFIQAPIRLRPGSRGVHTKFRGRLPDGRDILLARFARHQVVFQFSQAHVRFPQGVTEEISGRRTGSQHVPPDRGCWGSAPAPAPVVANLVM